MFKYVLFVFAINTFVISNCEQVDFKDLRCDFKKDTCKWTYKDGSGGPKMNFKDHNERSLKANGPLRGPIYGQKSNFAEFSRGEYKNKYGEFQSAIIKPIKTMMCFSFYYYTFGPSDISMTLWLYEPKPNGQGTLNMTDIWNKYRSHNDMWHRKFITIYGQSNPFYLQFSISIEPEVLSSSTGILALSSFDIKMNSCDQDYSDFTGWDFEDRKMGSWTEIHENADYKWNIIAAANSAYRNPQTIRDTQHDHTTMTMQGYMAEVTSMGKKVSNGTRTTLKSAIIQGSNSKDNLYCLSFWFWQRKGKDLLEIAQEVGQDGSEIILWSIDDYNYPSTEWHQGRVTINFNYSSQSIKFIATKLSDGGVIDLDDIKLTNGKCPPPVSCDFNNDWCGWTYNIDASDKSKMYWELVVGRVADASKLQVKHLISDSNPYGGLIYADFTKNTDNQFKMMELFSDVVHDGTPSTGSCLEFSFMARSGDQYLEVYITDMKSRRVKSIWSSLDWPISDKWSKIEIDVNYNKTFRFMLTVQSKSQDTYLLVDNVSYLNNPCTQVGITTKKPTTTIPTTTAAPSHAFDCDFENGWCNWKLNKTLNHNSTFSIKDFDSQDYHILNFDHTRNNRNGKYVYHNESNIALSGSIYAVKNSNHQKSIYHGPVCLKFWYYIITDSGDTSFNLTLYQNGNPIKRFYQADDHGNKWNLGMIQYEMKENEASEYMIVIVSHVQYGSIGFDDFKVSYSYCGTGQHVGECYFEGGDCGLKPSNPLGQPNWKITKGSQLNIVDHTLNSGDGSLFAVDFSQQQQNKRDQVELTSYFFAKTQGTCVQFYYFMNGVNSNQTLNFAITQVNQQKIVWHVTGNQGAYWYVHRETIVSPELAFKLNFISNGQSTNGIIAVDDVTIDDSGPCRGTSDFCNFETDTCSWQSVDPKQGKKIERSDKMTNYALDYIDAIWFINSPSNRFKDPPTDHTLKTKFGNYLMIKSDFVKPRWATLMSDRYDLQQTNGLCLEFYYYIHNDTRSMISNDGNIIVWKSESIDKLENIANLTTTNQWTQAKFSLRKSNLQSTNMFIYLQGGTTTGDSFIAIDDVAVKKGICNDTEDNTFFWCDSNTKISRTKVCDFIKDCFDGKDELNCGDCDFENNNCGYINMQQIEPNEFMWRSGHSNVGPKIGYSNSHGFMYASRLKGFYSIAPNAILYSPIIQSCSLGGTISFAYYLSSPAASLTVLFTLFEEEEEFGQVVLWKSEYEKNYKFKSYQMKTVHLIRRKVEFQIDFEAQINFNSNNSLNEFVALDQVKASCEPPKKSASCNAQTQFKCKNGVCIDSNQVCDFNDNCDDGSDELNCDNNLMCSFENGLCDWQIQNKKTNLWTIESGYISAVYGPTYDHTIGLRKGHNLGYVYSPNFKTFADGTVLGPTFNSKNQCEMRYFISIEGNFNGKFMIGIKNTKTNAQLTLKTYDKPLNNYFWLNDSVKLSSPNQWSEFQVYLFADIKSNDNSDSYIAIDDVSFKNCIKINSTNTSPPYSTSTEPVIGEPQTHSKAGPILIGIFVPLTIVALIAGGFLYYRKYKLIHINHVTNIILRRSEDTTTMTVAPKTVYDANKNTVHIEHIN